MKRAFVVATLIASFVFPVITEARRVVRTRSGRVVVRRGPVVRVTPRVHLTRITFRPVVVTALPAPDRRVWSGSEEIDRKDGWVDFNLDVDRRGERLLFEIDRGSARVDYAEVVFENGEAQVIEFNENVHRTGIYELLDFKDGRKVDHVRIIAKADSANVMIRMHLIA